MLIKKFFVRRKKMNKLVKCILLILLGTFVALSAFGGGGEKEKVVKEEKIKLVYLSKWNVGEVTQQIINDAIEKWMKDNPNVEVERIWAGRDVNAKLMAMLQGGNPPDFYDEDPKLIEESLGKAGLALDLTPYLKSVKAYDLDKTVWECFSPGFFDPWTFRGEINTLPIQQYITFLWYNKTLFKQLGITKLPETWPEFLDLCEKIKKSGIAPIIMDGGVDFYNLYYYEHLVERILGPTAFLDAIYDKTGKTWDNPGYLKAARMVVELRERGYFIEGFEGYQFPAGQIDWVQRKGALILIHSYMPIEVSKSKPGDFVFGAFPFPAVPGGKGDRYHIGTVVGGVAILKNTKDPDLAFDLLKRLVSKEVQTRFAKEALNIPTIVGVPLPEIFRDVEDIMKKQTGSFLDVASGPGQFEPEYAQTIMYPLNEKMLFGEITPEDFIRTVKEKTIEYWKRKG